MIKYHLSILFVQLHISNSYQKYSEIFKPNFHITTQSWRNNITNSFLLLSSENIRDKKQYIFQY